MNDMVSKSNVLDIYAELYDIFDDNKAIQKILNEVYDKINNLKEQEPVTWSYEYNCFVCSNCGLRIEDEVHYLMSKPLNFCPACGRKVKWDA